MHNSVHRSTIWRMIQMYGAQDRFVEAIKCFYKKSCVKVGREENDVISLQVGLGQGCVMSL